MEEVGTTRDKSIAITNHFHGKKFKTRSCIQSMICKIYVNKDYILPVHNEVDLQAIHPN